MPAPPKVISREAAAGTRSVSAEFGAPSPSSSLLSVAVSLQLQRALCPVSIELSSCSGASSLALE